MTDQIEPKFKIGQVVKLNSGSPDMTVKSLETNFTNPWKQEETTYYTGFITCTWFEGDTLKEEKFQQDLLT